MTGATGAGGVAAKREQDVKSTTKRAKKRTIFKTTEHGRDIEVPRKLMVHEDTSEQCDDATFVVGTVVHCGKR